MKFRVSPVIKDKTAGSGIEHMDGADGPVELTYNAVAVRLNELTELVESMLAASAPKEKEKCTQRGCGKDAVSWCLWPTGQRVAMCQQHDTELRSLCAHMGWAVQFNEI